MRQRGYFGTGVTRERTNRIQPIASSGVSMPMTAATCASDRCTPNASTSTSVALNSAEMIAAVATGSVASTLGAGVGGIGVTATSYGARIVSDVTEQSEDRMRMQPDGGSRPVPDPTVATTDQLLREIAALRREVEQRDLAWNGAHQDLKDSQITQHSDLKEILLNSIAASRDLSDEKFTAIDEKFAAQDQRTAEQKKDTKDALDAALAAQKEAVKEQTLSSEKSILKSETATTERIKATEQLLATSSKSTDEKIAAVEKRVDRIEAAKLGAGEAQVITRDTHTDARAMAMIVLTVVSLLIAAALGIVAALKP